MKEVQPGVQVEVAYTLRADGPDGEELESCNEETPFVFTVGQEEVLEAFEAALIGKFCSPLFCTSIIAALLRVPTSVVIGRSLPSSPRSVMSDPARSRR